MSVLFSLVSSPIKHLEKSLTNMLHVAQSNFDAEFSGFCIVMKHYVSCSLYLLKQTNLEGEIKDVKELVSSDKDVALRDFF